MHLPTGIETPIAQSKYLAASKLKLQSIEGSVQFERFPRCLSFNAYFFGRLLGVYCE